MENFSRAGMKEKGESFDLLKIVLEGMYFNHYKNRVPAMSTF